MLNACRIDVKRPLYIRSQPAGASPHTFTPGDRLSVVLALRCYLLLFYSYILSNCPVLPEPMHQMKSRHFVCYSILGYHPCCLLLMAPMGRGWLPLLLLLVLPLTWLPNSSCIQHLPPPHLRIAANAIVVCGLETICIYTCVVPEHLSEVIWQVSHLRVFS